MDNQTYNISRVVDGISGSTVFAWRGFKGTTRLTLNFSFPNTTNHSLIKMKLRYDDGSTSVYPAKSVPTSLNFTVTPSPTTYIDKRYIQVTLFYSNFVVYEYIIPYYIAQSSTQSLLGGAHVYNSQFVDTDNGGDMLAVIKSGDKIYNMLVYANQTSYASLSTPAVDVLAALSADLITINPIITEFDDNVEVIHPT